MRSVCTILGLLLAFVEATATPAFTTRCLQAHSGQAVLRVLHFGDSHLAGGGQTAFSRFFQGQFPGGGAGFGLPWVLPRPGLRAKASSGWRKSGPTGSGPRLSLAGGQMEAHRAGEWASVEGAFTQVRVHALRTPGGGRLTLSVDGAPLGELDLDGGSDTPARFQAALPASAGGSHRLELRTTRAGRSLLLGISLEGPSGAVYSPIAFNGARAAWLAQVPDSALHAQLAAEAPDLILLAFGTNEANSGGYTPEAYQQLLEGLLTRLRRSAPGAQLVLVGPPDGQMRLGSSANLASVIAIQQALAHRHGALFVDRRQAMGGAGSIDLWAQQGLAHRDLIHLTPQGYDRLTQPVLQSLFADPALSRLAAAASRPLPAPRQAPPQEPSGGRWLFWMRDAQGRLTITDQPDQFPGCVVERKERMN